MLFSGGPAPAANAVISAAALSFINAGVKDIVLRTARANPGKGVSSLADLADPEKNAKLRAVFAAFDALGIDGLVSIGGDDTLKTANYVYRIQELVEGLRPI